VFGSCGKGMKEGWIQLRVAKETQCETTGNSAVSLFQNNIFLIIGFSCSLKFTKTKTKMFVLGIK